MSCPEPLPSRIPRQLLQGKVQTESESPQLMTWSDPDRAPATMPGKSAEKEKKDNGFPPHPRAPRGTSAPAGAPAQTGVRGMAQGNLPAVSQGTFFPVSVSSPMMYVGKGGNCMAEPGP